MGRSIPPRERLAALLKQGSSIPELKDFRSQCRDVFRLGGVMGLDHWLEARRNLGLFPTRQVERAADDLEAVLGRVIDEATTKPAPAPGPSLTWEQRVELINARETKRRNAKPKPPPHRKPKPQPKPRVQRQRPLSPTTPPDPKPLSLLQRMAAAWDRLTPSNRHE